MPKKSSQDFLVYHIFMKRLTKLGFVHKKKPYGNELWLGTCPFLTETMLSVE